MRLFKAQYKDKTGKTQKSKRWYIDFRDHNEIRRGWPALEDKEASQEIGKNIEKLVQRRTASAELDDELISWLEVCPLAIRRKLISTGILRFRNGFKECPTEIAEIIGLREFPINATFIYFLVDSFRGNQVTYVGQSNELHRRIKMHRKSKSFDRAYYVECQQEKLNEVEADWQERLNPPDCNDSRTKKNRKKTQ